MIDTHLCSPEEVGAVDSEERRMFGFDDENLEIEFMKYYSVASCVGGKDTLIRGTF